MAIAFTFLPEENERVRSRCGLIWIERCDNGPGTPVEYEWQVDVREFSNLAGHSYKQYEKLTTSGCTPTMEEAKTQALTAAQKYLLPLIEQVITREKATNTAPKPVDVTGKSGEALAIRGLPRPTMQWDGSERMPDGDPGGSATYNQRFTRLRSLPVMYSTEDAAAASTFCSTARLYECHYEYLCSCCGEKIEEKPDAVSWIVDDGDDYGVPGSVLCTECAYMTLKLCPHYALQLEQGRVNLTCITGPDGYYIVATDLGGSMPNKQSDQQHPSDWNELCEHIKQLRQAKRS